MSQTETAVNPFGSSEAFSKAVEDLVWAEDITYAEALSLLVEEHQIDYDKVKSMIGQSLVEKMEQDAIEARVIRKERSTNTLDSLF